MDVPEEALVGTAQLTNAGQDCELRDFAVETLRQRRARASLFSDLGRMLTEPAWDVMLDLYVNGGLRKISITSACLAAYVPATTALRVITDLCELGFIEKVPDPSDGRRTYLNLSLKAKALIEAWLQSAIYGLQSCQFIDASAKSNSKVKCVVEGKC